MTISRYENLVLETQGDETFEFSNIISGKILVKIVEPTYTTPPIPEGYEYVRGHWYNGFVIKKLSDNSRFVWIPVGYLDEDGTLDNGTRFNLKFGRRNYYWNTPEGKRNLFSQYNSQEYIYEPSRKMVFYEEMNDEFIAQVESVSKYGGFYISQFLICYYNGEYLSHCNDISRGIFKCCTEFKDAFEVAQLVESREDVKSHLTYASEYDSMMAWLVKSQITTLKQITDFNPSRNTIPTYDSFMYDADSIAIRLNLNNICDINQISREWTQELYKKQHHVSRGGSGQGIEAIFSRNVEKDCLNIVSKCGFRVALWIK